MIKVLSICIPSYNMEKYINRCVDSLIVDEILDKLEIIIVNDGSKDSTLKIANAYKEKYPNSIIVIDKKNGHYGSCINAALKIAHGKYFRVLDADDWFNRNALVSFVNILENTDADVIFNKHIEYHECTNSYNSINYNFTDYNCCLNLTDNIIPQHWLFIHCITYRLNHLKKIGYIQTEGICYTDNEFTFIPISKAQTMYISDIILTIYYIGREDQSISVTSRRNNISHFIKVLYSISKTTSDNCNINYSYLKPYYIFDLIEQILILTLPYKNFSKSENLEIRKNIDFLKQNANKLYQTLMANKIIKLWYKVPFVYRISKWIITIILNKNA